MFDFLIGSLVLFTTLLLNIPRRLVNIFKYIALSGFILIFFWSLCLWIFFDKSLSILQFFYPIEFLSFANIDLVLGVDGLTLFFIILTTFITVLSLLAGWHLEKIHLFIYILLAVEIALIFCFSVWDTLGFYIVFEVILIPMFFLIGYWGSRSRKIKAAYFLFLFTVVGSLFMLFALFILYNEVGTLNWLIISQYNFSLQTQLIVWFCFFMAFIVKIPSFPFYIWLPEAHVEAPTPGSVILAALLLKLGGYALIRFLISAFPYANIYYKPLFYWIAGLSIFFASFAALRQIDLKRIVAYSSIAHMNFGLLGMASLTYFGLQGSIFLMIGHGFVAAALFLMVGVLYDRYHVRAVKYYGGLAMIMPIYAAFFFFFSLANFSLPGTVNFIGEVLILVGLMRVNFVLCILMAISIFFSAAFSVWTCNRIIFGTLGSYFLLAGTDTTRKEFFILLPLVIGALIFGLQPNLILDYLTVYTKLLVI